MRARTLSSLLILLAAGAARAQVQLNEITSVQVKDEGERVAIVIQGTRPPNFTTFSMADPPRFVIDLSESRFQGVPPDIDVGDGVVNVVKNLSYGSDVTSIARVMVAFAVDVEPPETPETQGNTLIVRFAKPAGAAAVARKAEADRKAKEEAEAKARAEAEAKVRAEADARTRREAEERARAESELKARDERDAADAQARAEKDRQQAEVRAKEEAAAQTAAEARARETKARADAVAAGGAPEEETLRTREPEAAPAGPSPAEQARLAREQAAADRQAAAERKAQEAADAKARAEEERRTQREERLSRADEERKAREQAAADKRAAAEQAAADRKAAVERKKQEAADAKARAAEERQARLDAAKAEREAAKAASAERLASGAPVARLKEIGFKQLPGTSRVFVRTDVTPRFTIQDVGENVVRVEFENTRVARRNDTRFMDTSFFASAVALITPSRQGSSYVVEIKLKQRVPYQQKVEGDVLAIDFERPAAAPGAAPATEPAGAAAPGGEPSSEPAGPAGAGPSGPAEEPPAAEPATGEGPEFEPLK